MHQVGEGGGLNWMGVAVVVTVRIIHAGSTAVWSRQLYTVYSSSSFHSCSLNIQQWLLQHQLSSCSCSVWEQEPYCCNTTRCGCRIFCLLERKMWSTKLGWGRGAPLAPESIPFGESSLAMSNTSFEKRFIVPAASSASSLSRGTNRTVYCCPFCSINLSTRTCFVFYLYNTLWHIIHYNVSPRWMTFSIPLIQVGVFYAQNWL